MLEKLKNLPRTNLILIILLVILNFSFIFINFFVIENIKEQKQKAKINIEELRNMSKEEIINYLELKQKMSQPLYFLDYVYVGMLITCFVSNLAICYLLRANTIKSNNEQFRKKLLSVFPVKYRKVIEELLKTNGQESQAILRQKLGLDKVQMTRLIKRMEEEGFVVVKKGGKLNYIELSDTLKSLFGLPTFGESKNRFEELKTEEKENNSL